MGRTPPALLAAAAVAAVGAAVLGEFAFSGVPVLISAAVLGFAVAEAGLVVAGSRSWPLAAGVTVLTVVSLGAAAWVFTGHRLALLAGSGWLALAVGGAVAGFRARPRSTTAGTSTGPSPAPSPDLPGPG